MEIQEHIPLAPYTTLEVGGPARFFARAATLDELIEAISFARERSLPIFILGGGSNLLVSDAGFEGLVVQITFPDAIQREGEEATVSAGCNWDRFVLDTCDLRISGVECLAGIPGLVGGSPIQNVGAYGQEAAQTIQSVTALDLETLELVTLPHDACGFAYRRSIFNTTHRDRYIVTGVKFRFSPDMDSVFAYADLQSYFAGKPRPAPLEVYHAVRSIRASKGMLLVEGEPDCRSAGSFFKNPIVSSSSLAPIAQSIQIEESAIPQWVVDAAAGQVKLPAAWLLERAGFYKGYSMGRAGLSSRHTLALINRGGATFAEIAALRDRIVSEVQDRFGIALEQEPVQLGH